MKIGDQFNLPSTRHASFTELLDKISTSKVMLLGLALYCVIPLLFKLLEKQIGLDGHFNASHLSFVDLLYFNFISILTIGYGDIFPLGAFRIYTVGEAILGLTLYSLMVSIITMKLILPRKNVIIFSKYSYYCEKDNAFLIIYLNTAQQFINNLETSWYFKLGEDWHALPPVKVPFITNSVQTFYLKYENSENLIQRLHQFDCLRVGLSGSLGMSSYSTYVQYALKDILIIADRKSLTQYEGFYEVDKFLKTKKFQEMFHYCPPNSSTLEQKLIERNRIAKLEV